MTLDTDLELFVPDGGYHLLFWPLSLCLALKDTGTPYLVLGTDNLLLRSTTSSHFSFLASQSSGPMVLGEKSTTVLSSSSSPLLFKPMVQLQPSEGEQSANVNSEPVAPTSSQRFGGTAATTNHPFGGTISTTSPVFGGTASTTNQVFGGAASTTSPLFGGTASTTIQLFGGTVSTTSQVFGGSASTTNQVLGGTGFSIASAASFRAPSPDKETTAIAPFGGGPAPPVFGGGFRDRVEGEDEEGALVIQKTETAAQVRACDVAEVCFVCN